MVNEPSKDMPLLVKVKLGVYVILCSGAVIAMAGLLIFADMQFKDFKNSNHILSKEEFFCTRSEQLSRNVDDQGCRQYSHAKIYREIVEPPTGARQGAAAVANTPQNAAPAVRR